MSDAQRALWPRPTAIEWLCLAASLLLSLQYSWLLDDAFIYFRYIDNLVHLGRGLVFNEGEYVEGFSSPLWCVTLVPLRALGLDWWMITRLLALGCAGLAWWLLVVLARRTAPGGVPIVNVPLAYLAFNYATQTYFTGGVEAPMVQLVAVAFALFVFAPDMRVAQWLVGLAPMIRHELALPLAIALAWLAWRERRLRWTPVLVASATLGAWLFFRVVYYADFLPNTFYLKDEVNWARGFTYLRDTFSTYGTYWLLPAFLLLALALRRERGLLLGARTILLLSALAVCAYVAKIGGDPRHYRYLAFPFVVLACAWSGLLEHALARWPAGSRRNGARLAAGAIAFGTFFLYPAQLSKHPFGRDAAHTKIDEINDAQYHRLKSDLTYSPWTLAPDIEQLDDAQLDLAYGESPLLPQGPVDIRDEYARWRASGETPASYPLTTIGWCATSWRMFTHTFVHWDGLTDPILARTSARSWRAAHKQDLHPLGADLALLRQNFGSTPAAFARAVEAGAAPAWIAANLDSLERIAAKAYNRHEFGPNLALALERIPRIDPSR
ncbi:MAG: hypothetical protein FJ294_10410 [Planctomycetes bacterium]|nr:hypothetical protein [Planctomycetota bacterium]